MMIDQLQESMHQMTNNKIISLVTVNSEVFASVIFSQNFAYAKFRENKIHAKSLLLMDIYINHAQVANF